MSSREDEQTPAHAPQEAVAPEIDNPGGFAHVPALDGIRGLAILLVVCCHTLAANNKTGNHLVDALGGVRSSLFVGVTLFFALSGFLITGILLDTLDIPHFFKTFYGRRSLRIFPLYYACLGFLLILTIPLHFRWNGWQYFLLTYTENFVTWPKPDFYIGGFNIHHFWSLQVEEQFYLVWPFIVYRVRDVRRLLRYSLITCGVVLLIRIGLVLTGAFARNYYIVYEPTYSNVDNLLIGCALCLALRTSLKERVLRYAPYAFAVCVLLMAPSIYRTGTLLWQHSPFLGTVGFSLYSICAASTIAMALKRGSLVQRFFINPFLRFLGKYSYGIYVFHYSVDSFLTGPLRAFFNEHLHSKGLSVLVAAPIVGGVAVLLAVLSYNLFEVHFLKLKRYFSYSRKPILQTT